MSSDQYRRHQPTKRSVELSQRLCPFPQCGERIAAAVFCCKTHWANVPGADRSRLADAFADYRTNTLSLPGLMEVQARISERIIGVAVTWEPIPRQAECPTCGVSVLLACGYADGRVMLDQVRNLAECIRLRKAGELHVVVGGRVALDDTTSAHPEALARYRFHPCGKADKPSE